MNLPQLGVAFLAGLLSFVSPCVLAVAPGYIGVLTGNIGGQGPSRRRAVLATIMFIAGFSLIFILMGAAFSLVGQFLRVYRVAFVRVLGTIVVIFALHQLGWIRLPWLYREKRTGVSRIKNGPFKPFLIGMAFAFGWSPCVGPILGMILALAGSAGKAGAGLALLAVYSLGMAVPFFVLAFAFTGFRRFSSFLLQNSRWVEIFSGMLLLTMGLLLFFDGISLVSLWLNRIFQGWSLEQWLQ